MIQCRYEPLEYLLRNGLPELSLECWEKMDDGFYREIYSPDWKLYKEQEDSQSLGFFAMREQGILTGYAVIKTVADIHQENERIALLHDVYITEKSRGHAVAFFHHIEKFVQQMGVYCLDVAERLSFDTKRGGSGKFYAFLGYRPMEIIHRKILGREGTA